MEIKDINYAVAGNMIGVIDLGDGTVLRCLEVHQVKTMELYGVAYNNGKKIYDGEMQDFRLPITSIRVQRVKGTEVLEIREFLTSIARDQSARKAYKAISELKTNLYHADLGDISLSGIEVILTEINLPYIRNAYGTAKTYFRSVLRDANLTKAVPSHALSMQLLGRDHLLYTILEAAASKEK